MPPSLTFDHLSLAAPDGRVLFADLSLTVAHERVGFVGRNGAGKSTLLAAIAGDVRPIAGTIAATGTIGLLDQARRGASAADLLGIAAMHACLDRIGRGAGSEEDFAVADWTLDERLRAALDAAGLGEIDVARRADSFSGGERMRLALARLYLDTPDIVLLDEPTNDLDREGRAAVAKLVAGWRGVVALASHDRALLEGMDRIVELSPQRIFVVGGGWSAFVAARDAERERIDAAADRADADVRRHARTVQADRERQARRDSAGRAFGKSGSVPRIAAGLAERRAEATAGRLARDSGREAAELEERRENARAQQARVTPLTIALPRTGLATDRIVLTCDRVVLDRGDLRLFGPLDLIVRGPERIAVSGANGSGKTSLLRLIAGDLVPTSGAVKRLVACAMLDQRVGLLDDAASLLDNLRRLQPGLSDNDAYAALARFAFRNRDALRRAGELSGGERLRAGLACVMASADPPPLLLLDEPTNHLDIESVEILIAALAGFDGALLLVSHDEAFLDAVGVTTKLDL